MRLRVEDLDEALTGSVLVWMSYSAPLNGGPVGVFFDAFIKIHSGEWARMHEYGAALEKVNSEYVVRGRDRMPEINQIVSYGPVIPVRSHLMINGREVTR